MTVADAGAPGAARSIAAGERWLLLAPHPDDETIATGGLLQRLRAAGAGVHVALLTDGGANPWPQRWLERRWRLDAAARARWARRRREECEAALRVLGVDPARELTALAWDDGALTAAFCAAPASLLQPLRALLARQAPTDVVLPAADDRHPDHNLCPVLLELALDGTGLAPRRHVFRVHGSSRGDSLRLQLTDAELARKRAALACHVTQMALSGARFSALAGAVETFDTDPFGAAASPATGWPAPVEAVFGAFQHDWRWRVVTRDLSGETRVASLPADKNTRETPSDGLFWKLEASRRGPWIYDARGWQRGSGQVRQGRTV